jgi:hypothetical protein
MNERLYNCIEKLAAISSVKTFTNARDKFVKGLKNIQRISSQDGTPQVIGKRIEDAYEKNLDAFVRNSGVSMTPEDKKKLISDYLHSDGNRNDALTHVKNLFKKDMSDADSTAFEAGMLGKMQGKAINNARKAGRIAGIDAKNMGEYEVSSELARNSSARGDLYQKRNFLEGDVTRVQDMREKARDLRIQKKVEGIHNPTIKQQKIDELEKIYNDHSKSTQKGRKGKRITAHQRIREGFDPRIGDLDSNSSALMDRHRQLSDAKKVSPDPVVPPKSPDPFVPPKSPDPVVPPKSPDPVVPPKSPDPVVPPKSPDPASPSDFKSHREAETAIERSNENSERMRQISGRNDHDHYNIGGGGGGGGGGGNPKTHVTTKKKDYMWPVLAGVGAGAGIGGLYLYNKNKKRDKED